MPAQPPAEAPDAPAADGDTTAHPTKLTACDGASCRWLNVVPPRPRDLVNVKCAACGIKAWR